MGWYGGQPPFEKTMAKQLLITVFDLYRLTTWQTKAEIRTAKRNGYVRMIRKDGKIRYDYNSIPECFLKPKTISA